MADQTPITDTRSLSADKPLPGLWSDIEDAFVGTVASTFGGVSEAPTAGENKRLGHYVGNTAAIGVQFLAMTVMAKAAPLREMEGALGHGSGLIAEARSALGEIHRLFKHPNLKETGVSVGMVLDWRRCHHLSWLNETRLRPVDAPVYKQVVGNVGHYLADKGLDKVGDKAVLKELDLLSNEERPQALEESTHFAANARARTAGDPRASTEVQLSWLEPESGIRVWAKPDVISYRGTPPNETMIIRDNKSRDHLRASDRDQLDLFATVAVKERLWPGKVEIVSELPATKSYMALPFDTSTIDKRVSALSADLRAMDKAWTSADPANFAPKLQDFCRCCSRRSECATFMALPARIRLGKGPIKGP